MVQVVKWFPGANVTELYPSLKGKRVLISGGGGSLGFEASKQLAKLGAKVYLSDITQEMALEAVEKIIDEDEGSDVVAAPGLNLNSLKSIRSFVNWMEGKAGTLDILINNTGASYMDKKPFDTEDGFAARAQVNFLGHYVLTRLLEPLLIPGSRVITVASVFHRFGKALHPEDLLKDWDGGSYPNCKLALVMFTKLLQEKWRDKGVVCVAVDPGAVLTGIWNSSKILSNPPLSWGMKAIMCPPEDAVHVYVHTAATKDITPGGYYARGIYAWDLITKGPTAELPMFARIVFVTYWDWFLRWITRGAILSETRRVAVSTEASKMEIAEELWNYCAEVAGIPK